MIKTTNENNTKTIIAFDIETTGLLPWYGAQATCIGATYETDKGIYQFAKTVNETDGEIDLINKFIRWLSRERKQNIYLLSQNGKQFDVPFLLARLAQIGNLSDNTINFLTGIPHIDLRDISRDKLENKAKHLELKIKKSANGLEAIIMAKEGRWEELKSYCMQDVKVTLQVYKEYLKRLGVE